MEKTKLFQEPTELEAPLVLKRGGRVIHISFNEMSPTLPIICRKKSTSTKMPLGTTIHNIEITLGRGGQLARAACAVAKLIANEGKSATLKLPSGRSLGKRPVVRVVVMNPVDHPHGGGKGRAPIGRKKPATLWGYPALGRSRKKNKYSDNLILHRRSK
ncbi:hypothetical protein ES332_D10G166000v1 [Gossypium tomentosum]|uniref:Large ribosomal subunit protein uL2 C-terminal domain-containing protein n=1 Tax=Gossypium tomentosum TaxID=34277 RepID=A0A5D2J626_GOSTO|nr:hypothetical protein ES332_D10G166000v1 [Gossypium tomentosum]